MVEIMIKIKLRVLNFGYVIAINMTIMCVTFQKNLQVSLKVKSNLLNIAPIELKFVVWVRSGQVNIPTKFQVNVRKLKFYEFYASWYSLYLLWSWIFEMYGVNCHGLIMNKTYKEIEIYLK